jgi:PAS domain S-box-containing protein
MNMVKTNPQLHTTFQQMMGGVESFSILLLDLDGTILTWNKGVEKIMGYTSSEIIGQNISMFYLPEDRQIHLPSRLLSEARSLGTAYHIGRRIRKNGSIFWGKIEITAIKDEQGNTIGFTNLARELKEETEIGHFWFDTDGILHTKASTVPHTPEKIMEFRQMISAALGNGGRICCIADIRDAKFVDITASFDQSHIVNIYKAVAFITNNPIDSNTEAVLGIIAGKIPTKTFTSREQAKMWIRTFLIESK